MYLQIEKKSIDKNLNLNRKEKWKLVFIQYIVSEENINWKHLNQIKK